MLLTVLVLVLALITDAQEDYKVRCSEVNGTRVSVQPSEDGEPGRYDVEYCAPGGRDVSEWQLVLNYLNETADRCNNDKQSGLYYGRVHTRNYLEVDVDLNCTYVCFSQTLDLLFRHCYLFMNMLVKGQRTSEPFNWYHYVDNNITGPEYFRNTSHVVKDFDYETHVSYYWSADIPITKYRMELCVGNSSFTEGCVAVTRNCSRVAGSAHQLQCVVAPRAGAYCLQLEHLAPWARTLNTVYDKLRRAHGCFRHERAQGVEVNAASARGDSAVWAVCGALGGAALVALAALGAHHSRLRRKLQARVGSYWLSLSAMRLRTDSGGSTCCEAARDKGTDTGTGAHAGTGTGANAGTGTGSERHVRRVLLLYARDCAAAHRVIRALHALLEAHATPQVQLEVLDIFSPEVMAMASSAPSDWIRAAFEEPSVRVVLVQTPALRVLQRCHFAPGDALLLEQPLLPRSVVYREPHFGDQLLQFALRLLAETAHAPEAVPYNKFYIATLCGVEAEVFPSVVRYRRYRLPGAAAALLHDLAGAPGAAPAPRPDAEAALAAAHAALLRFLDAEPHYLAAELMHI